MLDERAPRKSKERQIELGQGKNLKLELLYL